MNENLNHSTVKIYNWQDKTILIAEDELSNFLYLEAILKSTQIKIIQAVNGVQALELFHSMSKIDLVLLDIKMPLLSGYEVAEKIKRANPNMPIIAQTAYAQAADRDAALESGCVDYISKPIKKEDLIELIAKYIL